MKLLFGSIAVVVAILLALAAPADAAPPERLTIERTSPHFNPCLGDMEDMTVVFDAAFHDDGKGVDVITVRSTRTTENGWIGGGRETDVVGPGDQVIVHFSYRMTGGDGSFYTHRVKATIDLLTGGVTSETEDLACRRS